MSKQPARLEPGRSSELPLDPTLLRRATDWSRLDWAIYWTTLGAAFGAFCIAVKVLA